MTKVAGARSPAGQGRASRAGCSCSCSCGGLHCSFPAPAVLVLAGRLAAGAWSCHIPHAPSTCKNLASNPRPLCLAKLPAALALCLCQRSAELSNCLALCIHAIADARQGVYLYIVPTRLQLVGRLSASSPAPVRILAHARSIPRRRSARVVLQSTHQSRQTIVAPNTRLHIRAARWVPVCGCCPAPSLKSNHIQALLRHGHSAIPAPEAFLAGCNGTENRIARRDELIFITRPKLTTAGPRAARSSSPCCAMHRHTWIVVSSDYTHTNSCSA